MVSAVHLGDVLLIVGGGIRSGPAAADLVRAGADMIVTGTAVESCEDATAFVSEVTASMRKPGSR
jgi:phosphoglycerol geranylgeranyltransferase